MSETQKNPGVAPECKKIKGRVKLMKKSVDLKDPKAVLLKRVFEDFGQKVSLQLITPHQEKGGKEAYLENWITTTSFLKAGEHDFSVTFDWKEDMGIPGAFIIKNLHDSEFYLKSLHLDVPAHGTVMFLCNSWVRPVRDCDNNRVFFSNKTYLPRDTPGYLRPYRMKELENLRGNGSGELKDGDRVYDYAYYNDLGDPDKGSNFARPVLGGSKEYPYPRRGRTGRKPTDKDPNTESRRPLLNLDSYVPRDERYSHTKFSDLLAYAMKSVVQVLIPGETSTGDKTNREFDTFSDVYNIYEGGITLPNEALINKLKNIPNPRDERYIHTKFFYLLAYAMKSVVQLLFPWKTSTGDYGQWFLEFSMPDVIKVDRSAWRTDEEFTREMLAGLNPVVITRLQKLPSEINSSIKEEDIKKSMNGLSIEQAIESKKMFILDHHDAFMPYLARINSEKDTNVYATRTLLLLHDDGTLKPLAIELSLPNQEGHRKVFTPAEEGIEGSLWQLAKAYVAVNDSGYHQLISHWLNTHAVIEPFVIATNRQLSVVHPIYKLLHPHFRDTMSINALARHILINAGGILEKTVFPGKFAMELSSMIYKNWVFTEQALPDDLIKRGMAVEDPSCPHGIKLFIEDYPYAVDGLEIWSAIETWVSEYCSLYYKKDDKLIQSDTELQSWWTEIRDVGHEDKKDEPWWPKMQTQEDLIRTCTTIIWVASALHAAVNFGQYPYAGFMPNRPTISRRFMPETSDSEYDKLQNGPDSAAFHSVFLKTITALDQTLLGLSVIELLSRHSTEEVYLGQRDDPDDWTSDDEPKKAFQRFTERLIEIEKRIMERNNNESLKNRNGPVKIPYTLLYPNTSDYSRVGGITGKGIPNSVSM